MGKQKLFDDDGKNIPLATKGKTPDLLKVNQDFAKRFEHNKKREEFQKLKEKHPHVAARIEAKGLAQQRTAQNRGPPGNQQPPASDAGDNDSSSSDDDGDDGYIPEKTEVQIFETLAKIRARDKSIYEPDTKFYSSDDDSADEEEEDDDDGPAASGKPLKEKPVYLKDVVYQQALRDVAGEGSSSSDDDEDNETRHIQKKGGVQTYDDEQKQLKNAFLQAFDEEGKPEEADAFGGVLKTKRRIKPDPSTNGDDQKEEGEEGGARIQQVLDAYFGKADQLPEEEKFLRDYLLNKKWADEDDYQGTGHSDDEEEKERYGADHDLVDDEYDEQYLQQADKFEANYNFRYEEPGSNQLITYPRNLEGIVRKEDDKRKRKRAEKAARLAEEEEKRASEVRRLKTLKRKEIETRLEEVKQVAGSAAPADDILASLVDGEFDPEAHDKAMAAAFGDDYYDYGDAEDDIADEEFEKELAAMADYNSDGDVDGDNHIGEGTFSALRKRLAEHQQDEEQQEEVVNEDNLGAEEAALVAQVRGEIKKLMEEYHKLDYEDHVGGIPTRFRYKQVPKADYGLSAADILMLDDKELNQIVGLKRVAAPYREDAGLSRPNYGKLNELRKNRGGFDQQYDNSRQGSTQRKHNKGKKGFAKQYDRNEGAEAGGGGVDDGKTEVERVAERRLKSFAKPTLKKRNADNGDGQNDGQNGKKRKRRDSNQNGQHQKKEEQQQQHQQQLLGSNGLPLTKAQKKNLARCRKRAAKSKDDV